MSGRWREFLNALAGRPAVRNVSLLAGGTVTAQAIALLSTPLLTRLYTPGQFGVLAAYASILGVLAVFTTCRYEIAIPLARDDGEAGALTVVCVAVLLLTTAIFGVIAGIWGPALAGRVANASVIVPYLWLLPVGLGLAGTYQTLNYLGSRGKLFGAISKTKVSQAIGQSAIQAGGGLAGVGAAGLVVGHIAGQCFGIGTLLRHTHPQRLVRGLSPRMVRDAAVMHWRFPVFSTIAAFISALGIQAVPFYLVGLFGTTVSGEFSLTTRVLSLPAMLVGGAVSQVLYPQMAASAYDGDALTRMLQKAATALLYIGVPFFAGIALWGEDIFAVCFGPQWREAGHFARLLSPLLMVNFVSSPLSSLSMVAGKHRTTLLITVIDASLRLGAIFCGGQRGSAPEAVLLYSAAGAAVCVAYIAWIFRLAGGRALTWLLSLRGYLTVVILLVGALAGLKLFLPTAPALIGAIVSLAGLLAWSGAAYRRTHLVSHD